MASEYFVHILNWPVEAESPEEAAKIAHRGINDPVYANFVYRVTTEEVELDINEYGWGGHPTGFIRPLWEFDSEEWEREETPPDLDNIRHLLTEIILDLEELKEEEEELEYKKQKSSDGPPGSQT